MKETTSHLIGGEKVPSTGDEGIPVTNPSNGDQIGSIPVGTEEDAARAVAAARAALPVWSRTPAAERAVLVKEAARKMRGHAREIAELVTLEMGKTVDDALGGVEAGIGTLEQYAELGPLHRGQSLNGNYEAADMMVHEPHGVAAVVVPWNDPIAIACGYIGAALVTGNTVVYKPSEKTPLSAVWLATMFDGLPAGVLNLLLGDERVGRPLVAHEDVDLVLFTGSVPVGREILGIAGQGLKKAVVELGGKDPMIVDRGVEPAWAAGEAAVGCFANAGQICTSVERIYVHEEVAEEFLKNLTARAETLRVGDGFDPDSEMGPIVDEGQRGLIHRHVTEAVEAGATLLSGGELPDGPGSFYPPTVLTGVRAGMSVVDEETFGPVAAVEVVRSFDEALEKANETVYGLAAAVLTPDGANAQRAWRELRAGTVKINAVFGGAPGGAASPKKASGLGFGYGPELLDEVTTTKVVHHTAPPRNA
ncbi:aldehyde dehydrogenase family protein [Rubrobacter marinus]|uniref:Aldehyde dehydrogenase family protein n=1 Tax=Rubrobacter marinus TaxID=2653852 RepID=A0A6G8Q376_9ACTN|nr:aldehyde dehydrogenase family protein [Rubrobacter marinus]